MKKSFAYLLLLSVILSACKNEKKADEFILHGSLRGLEDGTKIWLIKQDMETQKVDTLASGEAKKQVFDLNGKITQPDVCILLVGSGKRGMPLFMEPSYISLSGSLDKLSKAEIIGSKSHDEFSRINTKIESVYAEQEKFYNAMDIANMSGDKEKLDSLSKEMEKIYSRVENMVKEYADKNPNSYAAPFVVMNNVFYMDPLIYSPIYTKFSSEVKNSSFGKALGKKIEVLAKTATGKQAPDIVGKDPQGNEISLINVKGKVTLIDFWASWCGPCRKENPNVVKIYAKYHDKGFNIFGVSLDEDARAWQMAIEKDGLTWNHVSDLKGWQSSYAKDYGVQAIPQTILIDAEGKIIARNVFGDELDARLSELLK